MRSSSGLLVACALVALSGCSLLLDFSEVGLPCSEAGECKEGYTCDKDSKCMPDGSPTTLCSGCGAFDKCVKAKCQPVCMSAAGDARGCAAGQSCDLIKGACTAVPSSTRAFGIPCSTDSDCADTSSASRCLRPYGGGDGFCTAECTKDNECAGKANKCKEFIAAKGTVKACAPESFLPCTKESDCKPSDLSCGAYAFGSPKTVAVMACRARLDGAAIGERCNSTIRCRNGLCVASPGSGIDGVCSTPCTTKGDCEETADPAKKNDAFCAEITLAPGSTSSLPKVRPQLCMIGDKAIGFSCQTSGTCAIDAPQCADFKVGANTVSVCAPPCGDDPADKCPSGTACRSSDGGQAGLFCGPPQ